jgi:beta-lactam-binding protein with PASTA domain
MGIANTAGGTAIAWAPHLASGQTRSADPLPDGTEIALQATVRFCSVPALKGKKLGAARQALAAADCTAGAVKKPKKKAARKKAKFVKSQSAAPGTSISDTAPIDLTLGKAPKKHRKQQRS